jgi:two-component system, sensor histidine kinase and response regulator
LTAVSTLGQGSCFSFTLSLPATDAVAPAADRVEVPIVGLEPGQPVCRILIADDLADNRAPLRTLLEGLNPQPPVLELREAADGREAVAIWEIWQPQVIFMDMRMPVLSGEEATRRIRSLTAERPAAVRSVVVALTASAFEQQRDHYLVCGCDAFARKPFRAEDVFDILERCAGLRFVRTADASPPCLALAPSALAARLATTPAGWCADLREAVALGEFDRITALLERIRHDDATLHEALARWAYDYNLDAFMVLFGDQAER